MCQPMYQPDSAVLHGGRVAIVQAIAPAADGASPTATILYLDDWHLQRGPLCTSLPLTDLQPCQPADLHAAYLAIASALDCASLRVVNMVQRANLYQPTSPESEREL